MLTGITVIFIYIPVEAIETCHHPIYVIRLQKEGQIPAKINFERKWQ